jgi:predicted TIM-barrel fold metal-dependent hydrolase
MAHEVASRYRELTVIIDHLGLSPQRPFNEQFVPWFRDLDQLLALSEQDNLFVKLSGAPTYSDEPYPYEDLWPFLRKIVDAFGAERVLWGSDISRIAGHIGFRRMETQPGHPGLHSYAEALHFIRDTNHLSDSEKSLILGETLERIVKF